MMLQDDPHTAATVTRDVRAAQHGQLQATPEQYEQEIMELTTPGSRTPMTMQQQSSPYMGTPGAWLNYRHHGTIFLSMINRDFKLNITSSRH